MSEDQALGINGERWKGAEARQQNVTAAVAIANVVKSSLGPIGLDKMIVNQRGEVMITNDGATILQQLDVEHPAGKVLVNLAKIQDSEVGDGTTSVVILAAELLKKALVLIQRGIHPQAIISGYSLAATESAKYINSTLATDVSDLPKETLCNIAATTLSSKILGSDSQFFSQMCVDAVLRVKTEDGKYPIKAINVLKSHGGSMKDSSLVEGFALNCTKASQAMPSLIKDAKIACLDFSLHKEKLTMGHQLVIKDVEQLEALRDRESDIVKERVNLILASGANVILSTKGIDDTALKYFVEAGAIAVRRVEKNDLKRISRAIGAKIVLSLADTESEEGAQVFEASSLGSAGAVSQEHVADHEMIFIKGTPNSNVASIVFRGPNSVTLDEMERAMHDAICVVSKTLESGGVCAGGGSVETALNIYLENFATTLGSRQQLAIAEFAAALLVIPKVLAVNAAKDAADLVARLRAYHNKAQTDASKKDLRMYGLDLVEGKVRDNLKAGVLEPAVNKVRAVQFATEAAVTLLRIDDVFRMNPKAEPTDPHGH